MTVVCQIHLSWSLYPARETCWEPGELLFCWEMCSPGKYESTMQWGDANVYDVTLKTPHLYISILTVSGYIWSELWMTTSVGAKIQHGREQAWLWWTPTGGFARRGGSLQSCIQWEGELKVSTFDNQLFSIQGERTSGGWSENLPFCIWSVFSHASWSVGRVSN